MQRRNALLPLFFLASAATAGAESLRLSLETTLDISALNLSSIGDLAFQANGARLWIVDAASPGLVFEVDRTTGALLSQFGSNAIPGLDGGPEAMAIDTTTPLARISLFSMINESEAGLVSETGTFIAEYPGANNATGADYDNAGNLWIVAYNGAVSTLHRLNPNTGVVLATVPILGSTSLMTGLTFDPHSGACYVLERDRDFLLELDTTTGAIRSTTDLTPFLIGLHSLNGGLDFDARGDRLYVATGFGAGADAIVVLQRDHALTMCDGADSFFPCPCGNTGAPGHGCASSVNANGGRLVSTNAPYVSSDTTVLQAQDVPATTSVLFFQGTGMTESGPLMSGDGLICVGGTIIRIATRAANGGVATYPQTGHDIDLSVRGAIPAAGGTRYYQGWYRNAASFCTPATYNYTNAIRLIWAP
ncbi:MAG: hypothetical protein HZA53_08355 [Planctomycetes bacterium]|nr:hypothetical protein [Planctomycetota bacterium]